MVVRARLAVKERQALERACQQCLNSFGVPSILVNNAGIDQPPGQPDKGCCLEEIPFELNLRYLKSMRWAFFWLPRFSAVRW